MYISYDTMPFLFKMAESLQEGMFFSLLFQMMYGFFYSEGRNNATVGNIICSFCRD